MIKTLKFKPHLISRVLSGEKTVTWRLFDDKDLSVGDRVCFLNGETGEMFTEVELTAIREKRVSDILDSDFVGHEKIENPLEHYRELYGEKVTPETVIKMISFKLV